MAVYNVYTAALRGAGNSRAPFFSILCSSVVNVVLDVILVVFGRMGVRGAAIATVVSQAAMTGYIVWYSRRYDFLRIHPFRRPVDRAAVKAGIHLGFPPMVQSCVNAFGNLICRIS